LFILTSRVVITSIYTLWNEAIDMPTKNHVHCVRRMVVVQGSWEGWISLSVKTLIIRGVNGPLLTSFRNFTSITSLYIEEIPNVKGLPNDFLQNHTLLDHLNIDKLRNLESLSNKILDNLFALKSLEIRNCDKLESLPEEGLQKLHSSEVLRIYQCRRLYSLPINGLCGLSSLRRLWIQSCAKFAYLFERVRYLTTLENLSPYDCPGLNSLPKSIQHLISLWSLSIWYCKGINFFSKSDWISQVLFMLGDSGLPYFGVFARWGTESQQPQQVDN